MAPDVHCSDELNLQTAGREQGKRVGEWGEDYWSRCLVRQALTMIHASARDRNPRMVATSRSVIGPLVSSDSAAKCTVPPRMSRNAPTATPQTAGLPDRWNPAIG